MMGPPDYSLNLHAGGLRSAGSYHHGDYTNGYAHREARGEDNDDQLMNTVDDCYEYDYDGDSGGSGQDEEQDPNDLSTILEVTERASTLDTGMIS
ncbi:unnamed protein product, partial [Heterosigma akashiwo]